MEDKDCFRYVRVFHSQLGHPVLSVGEQISYISSSNFLSYALAPLLRCWSDPVHPLSVCEPCRFCAYHLRRHSGLAKKSLAYHLPGTHLRVPQPFQVQLSHLFLSRWTISNDTTIRRWTTMIFFFLMMKILMILLRLSPRASSRTDGRARVLMERWFGLPRSRPL